LLNAVRERLGKDSVTPNARLLSYKNSGQGITALFTTAEGKTFSRSGDLLVGADGIHSQMRKQMYPQQGDVHWNGAVM
jgi:2-polyprenyl-6-methoxyphenol hydroxylase-like FAD-dependent oxidoreductase